MEVRYIEIKTSPAGQIIRAYTPEQYKKEMARRKNATARARKLTRLQERVGAVLAMLGFLMLLGAGGMCEIGQIIGYGLAGLFLFVFGVWLAHGFYGQADKAEWARESLQGHDPCRPAGTGKPLERQDLRTGGSPAIW